MKKYILATILTITFIGCQNSQKKLIVDEVVVSNRFIADKVVEKKIVETVIKTEDLELKKRTVSIDNLIFQDWNFPDFMNWYSAKDYCDELELNTSIKTYSNWRLPNNLELNIAYQNREKFNTMIADRWYWSIEEYIPEIYRVWIIQLSTGETSERDAPDVDYPLCVHDVD